jgi:23S rRNA pseudouridine1911/1915/1917 synthase
MSEDLEIEKEEILETEKELFFYHYDIVVDKGQEPTRLDVFLVNRIENVSRTKCRVAIDGGHVTVNGKTVKANYKIQPHDAIDVNVPRPFNPNNLAGEDIPLEIMYEDDDMLIINKQSNLVVHPGIGNYSGTLVNALLFYYQNLPNRSEDLLKPGLVHRLDKDTTGVMVIAKNDWAMSFLAKQFEDRTMHRRYVTLVWGNVDAEEGRIEGNIGRHPRDRKLMTVFKDGEAGKHAVTHYKVLERFGYVTLVECRLETGRTHQIRVHMKSIGHTVFNDERYGGDQVLKGTIFSKYKQFVDNCFAICPRQALHARLLGVTHPVTKEEMFFEKDMPDDMLALVAKWRYYMRDRYDQEDAE